MRSLSSSPIRPDAVEVPPARSGRPSAHDRTYRPDELVRVEIRMPAKTAVRLFDRARSARTPVSATASELLRCALDAVDEGGEAVA